MRIEVHRARSLVRLRRRTRFRLWLRRRRMTPFQRELEDRLAYEEARSFLYGEPLGCRRLVGELEPEL